VEDRGGGIERSPARKAMGRLDWLVASAFAVAATALDAVRYWLPDNVYFDEIYYVGSAKQYLENIAHVSRTEFPYEWTHPPLSKLLIAAFVWMFGGIHHGLVPAVWRLPEVLLGGIIVFAAYMLARELSQSTFVAGVAAFMLTIDGFRLVQSRIATPEMLLGTLTVVMLLAVWKVCVRTNDPSRRTWAWLIVLAASAGALVSTKWSGAPTVAFALLCLVLVARSWKAAKPSLPACLAVVIVGAMLTYLGSYLPHFRAGWTLSDVASLQVRMYEYHDRLSEDSPDSLKHPYASAWWQWPLLAAPVVYYFEKGPEALKTGPACATSPCEATIVTLPNPITWWLGFAAIVTLGVQAMRRRDPTRAFVVAAYLAQWLPWALSPRADFFYNIFPALPIMTVAAAMLVGDWWKTKANRPYLVVSAVGVAAVSAYFLPVLIALPLTDDAWLSRMWLDNWLRIFHVGNLHGFSWIRPN
jgi:dolichyl-phosphate-mannose-protein mannosyltransferase